MLIPINNTNSFFKLEYQLITMIRQVFNYNILIRQTLEKNPQKEYREEMQEVMLELKLKTDKFMKKLKKEIRQDKFRHSTVK